MTEAALSAIIARLLEAQAFDIKDGEEPSTRVGIDCSEGPPVPNPNTEVKLVGAEDTWLVTAWDNRKTPTQTFLNSSAGRACDC